MNTPLPSALSWKAILHKAQSSNTPGRRKMLRKLQASKVPMSARDLAFASGRTEVAARKFLNQLEEAKFVSSNPGTPIRYVWSNQTDLPATPDIETTNPKKRKVTVLWTGPLVEGKSKKFRITIEGFPEEGEVCLVTS